MNEEKERELINKLSDVLLEYADEGQIMPSLICTTALLVGLLKCVELSYNEAIQLFKTAWESEQANENNINQIAIEKHEAL